MKRTFALILTVCMILSCFSGCGKTPQPQETQGSAVQETQKPTEAPLAGGVYQVGVASVDITPKEAVSLVGGNDEKKTAEVDTNLYVKALAVKAEGGQTMLVITLDTLKYPVADEAVRRVSAQTGIPQENILIVASHTHSGPFYTYYFTTLYDEICAAAEAALADMTACTLGVANAKVEGVAQNRRWLDPDGDAWNAWLIPGNLRPSLVNNGPEDPEVELLAAVNPDGTYKAVLWNFASHADSNRNGKISADYPGHVQQQVNEKLGYETMTFFVPGAAGDINPIVSMEEMSAALTSGVMEGLGALEIMEDSTIAAVQEDIELAGREDPVFNEEEIKEKWADCLEIYRNTFDQTLAKAQETYTASASALCIGNTFAISANPTEMFNAFGWEIKALSPWKHTMIAEATNGFLGYLPTEEDFRERGYECWYGEHSYLAVGAGKALREHCSKLLQSLTEDGVDETLLDGMSMELFRILDTQNIIVRFSGECYGCTDAPFYKLVDATGKEYKVVSAVSAFMEMGGGVPNVFKLTLEEPLTEGETYCVAGIMMYDSLTDTKFYKPMPAVFQVSSGTQAAQPAAEPLSMSLYKFIDESQIIVQFNQDCMGCTDAPNYTVTDSNGKRYEVKKAESAYAELGGEAPNVFKLTFAEKLPEGDYTVTANMAIAGEAQAPVTVEFSVSADGESGMKIDMDVYKIVDASHVIVRFEKPCIGCTDAPNYTVTDSNGNTVKVVSATSAFMELGGGVPDVFKLTFEAPLAPGKYTVTAKNIAVNVGGPVYAPTRASFTIKNDTPSGEDTPKEQLKLSVYKVVNNKNVIVQFSHDIMGATDVPNYKVTDADGNAYAISSVGSAFVEIGGAAPNVFKITMAKALAAGTYTVTATGMVSGDPNLDTEKASVEFTIEASEEPEDPSGDPTFAMDIYKIVDASNIIVQLDKEVNGATEVPYYTVKDAEGNAQEITAVSSAFVELGGVAPNVFKITLAQPLAGGAYTITAKGMTDGAGQAYAEAKTEFSILGLSVYKVVDSKNVIVQFSHDIMGATDVPNYKVTDAEGNTYAISSVGSAFMEIGGAAPNVFKVTMAKALAAGNYTVTAIGMVSGNPSLYTAEAAVEFTIEASEEPEDPSGDPTFAMDIYKIVDASNIIVQLDKEVNGATEVPYYTVKDAEGNAQEIVSVSSAFVELGGVAPNVFKITLAQPLAGGAYTITAKGMTDGAGQAYAEAKTEFSILGLSVYKVVDSKNVIVQFSHDIMGATDVPNYKVTDAEGNTYAISSVGSAFMEIGGAAPNVFKITLAQPLAGGTYTVTAKGMTSSNASLYTGEASVEFTVEASEEPEQPVDKPTFAMSIYKIVDNSNIIVQFDREVNGATDVPNYTVADAEGNTYPISSVGSAFVEIGGAAPNVFKITLAKPLSGGTYTVTAEGMTDGTGTAYAPAETSFSVLGIKVYKIVDASNIIVQFDREVNGATEVPFYTLKDADDNSYTITAVNSAFVELNGEAPNVFKITLENPLTAGKYTLTVKGMTCSDDKLFTGPILMEFEIS